MLNLRRHCLNICTYIYIYIYELFRFGKKLGGMFYRFAISGIIDILADSTIRAVVTGRRHERAWEVSGRRRDSAEIISTTYNYLLKLQRQFNASAVSRQRVRVILTILW